MSLRTIMQRNATLASRRFASLATAPKPPIPASLTKNKDFKTTFLSDPSTYPLIVIMTTAMTFMVGMSINGLGYKNVKITPSAKHETMPQDSGRRTTLVEIITREPRGFHAQGFKDIRREGLGVDHEEWLKSKGR
ncbi:hypothetical protein FisN_20Hh059 [Fistulifera solaris]|uniref:Uncharacterized protein n=1 Tax=Fistulifera solaris TaxID=1519565 RepID=A0A1Z5KC40_FISSO|nr:hypothetical protein FisN_20Hh059 [Fistulifera solaris]|eukprot:GAX23854.1 hypothetical protein FisN_20Hh059 [Fistulifera solaris]